MKKFGIFLIFFLLLGSASFAALMVDYQLTNGSAATVYNLGDATLAYHASAVDILNGNVGSVTAGGFHPDTAGGVANLTDGTWEPAGLTVIASDNAYPGTSLQVEWTFPAGAQISEIIIFSGHDGVGRGFINCKVEVDTGTGYTLLKDEAKTGDYEQVQPAGTTMVGYVRLYNSLGGNIATSVDKLRITFYCVSHSSTQFFQKFDDLHSPAPNNYPNQGTILKEVDVFGTSSVLNWELF